MHDKIGMTFSAALRSLLRQDPDVVMLGEIRDAETARHRRAGRRSPATWCSARCTPTTRPASITRLINIGVEPYLISAGRQRDPGPAPGPKNLPALQGRVRARRDEMKEFLTLQGFAADKIFKGKGCDRCRKTGYSGRLGIYELLVMDDTLRDMVTRNPDVTQLRKLCRERGWSRCGEDGFEKVMKGLTTVDEILRVTENATNATSSTVSTRNER